MNEFPEVGELEKEARRLLRYRTPLVLAVVINFVLLFRMPYARALVETPTSSSPASPVLDVAAPVPPDSSSVVSAAGQVMMNAPVAREEIAEGVAPPASAEPAEPAMAASWALTFAHLEAAARHQGAALQQQLGLWMNRTARDAPETNDTREPNVVPHEETAAASVPTPPADPEPVSGNVVNTPAADSQPDVAPPASGLILRNARENGGPVSFLVNGRVHELLPGEAHEFAAGESWIVQFHRGESFGNVQRTLPRGAYRFVVTDQGWNLEAVTP